MSIDDLSHKRTPKEKAIAAAKVTMAMLAAQAAFAAYAAAPANSDIAPPPCPSCPPTTLPTVTRTVPADDATGVDRDKSISAFFSEEMDPATIDSTTVNLYRGEVDPANEVAAKVSYDAGKDRAILNPNNRLAGRTTYRVVVEGAGDGDALQVEDAQGDAMQGEYRWNFKTGRR